MRRSPATRFTITNQPDFLHTNLTLRLALAPVYLDSEFGFVHGLGRTRTFAIGLAGGGYADSYNEIRGGTFFPRGIVQRALRRDFNQRLSFVQPRRPDSVEFDSARHGALFHFLPAPTVPRPRFNCRRIAATSACAPVCAGGHRTDAVPGARDGIVRLV